MYHSIADNSEFFSVSASDFEKQVAYLSKNKYKIISALKLVEFLKNKDKIPPKTIVITFDDGYEDNYLKAFPILEKYGFSASIFVTTGSIGSQRKTSRGTSIPTLSWAQIKEMSLSGRIDFFPHTHTHPQLDSLSDKDAREEIAKSKNIMENKLSKKMTLFAYPYGRSNPKIKKILEQEGFQAAFTVEPGAISRSSKVELLSIKRNSVDSGVSLPMFKGIVKHGRI